MCVENDKRREARITPTTMLMGKIILAYMPFLSFHNNVGRIKKNYRKILTVINRIRHKSKVECHETFFRD